MLKKAAAQSSTLEPQREAQGPDPILKQLQEVSKTLPPQYRIHYFPSDKTVQIYNGPYLSKSRHPAAQFIADMALEVAKN